MVTLEGLIRALGTGNILSLWRGFSPLILVNIDALPYVHVCVYIHIDKKLNNFFYAILPINVFL